MSSLQKIHAEHDSSSLQELYAEHGSVADQIAELECKADSLLSKMAAHCPFKVGDVIDRQLRIPVLGREMRVKDVAIRDTSHGLCFYAAGTVLYPDGSGAPGELYLQIKDLL
jgi:hypothetical protein